MVKRQNNEVLRFTCNRWKATCVKSSVGLIVWGLGYLALSSFLFIDNHRDRIDVAFDLIPSNNIPTGASLKVMNPPTTVSAQVSSSTKVVILTHQRCGSSFFGRLFNFDPNVFYVYEPLDALYTSLYGTFPGWSVAYDIFSNGNGSPRKLPSHEINGVADFLNNLLSCRIDNLPTELLIHKSWMQFWAEMNSAGDFSGCVNRRRLVDTNLTATNKPLCYELLSNLHVNGVYERRFHHGCNIGDELCYRLLHDLDYIDPNATTNDKALRYRHCLKKRRQVVDEQCSSLLESACSSRPIRVAKVVRGTMQSMEQLLDKVPDLRVIHLVRDPRGVVLSRANFCPSIRGIYAKGAGYSRFEYLSREAKVYCQQMAADIRHRKRLEDKYPGQLYTLHFEQIADDPVGKAREIYHFIGESDIPSKTLERFMFEAWKGNLNASGSVLASKWKQSLGYDEIREIERQCADFLQLVPEYEKIADRTVRQGSRKRTSVSSPSVDLSRIRLKSSQHNVL